MDNDSPKITFAVINYNNGDWIKRCLKSVIDQANEGIEILVVDDGSTDESVAICNDFQNIYPDLRVIVQQNAGVSVARNTAIDAARGQYISFIDSDDELAESAVKYFLDALAVSDADIIFSDYRFCGAQDIPGKALNCSGGALGSDCREKLISACFEGLAFSESETTRLSGSVWAKAYRVDFLKSNLIYSDPSLRRAQDIAFNIAALMSRAKSYYLPKETYRYYVISSSVSHRTNPMLCDQIELFLLNVREQIKDVKNRSVQNDYCFCAMNQVESICLNGGYLERGISLRSAIKLIMEREVFSSAVKRVKVRSIKRLKENLKLFLYKCHAYALLAGFFSLRNRAGRER